MCDNKGHNLGYSSYMYPLPKTAEELGKALRNLRGDRGLRQLAASQPSTGIVLSKSSLARFEAGQRPSLQYADHLSKLYGGDGWVEVAIRNLWISDWDPWSEEMPSVDHVISWPASYSGMVWILIYPNPYNVNISHLIQIRWGPWRCRVEAPLSNKGILLTTGKSQELVAVSCHINTSHPTHLLHGVNATLDSDTPVLDISQNWEFLELT